MQRQMLIRTEGVWPPGGFPFLDGVTGKEWKDTRTSFSERIKQVIAARSANPRLVGNPMLLETKYVAVEISIQNCERLRGDPRYCTGGAKPVAQSAAAPAPPPTLIAGMVCKFCNAQTVSKSVCVSCGNRTTFNCTTCKKVWR